VSALGRILATERNRGVGDKGNQEYSRSNTVDRVFVASGSDVELDARRRPAIRSARSKRIPASDSIARSSG
jgi:hypothetical protein